MNAHSGEILWSTANPSNATTSGPVTVANHVLFVGSIDPKGPIYAWNAKTRDILMSYETGATVFGGMSVSDGCIYVGNGYSLRLGSLSPASNAGASLYAFCLI
ncbi:hypothetical protein CFP56_010123 [Quercus suber]|uniref:Pyrrolo-quinoline quinone repeat domain-containing protein n=1 Tax=Quercus suber TaxID=58331 RepID=A0AAW0L2F2_QUESU